MNCPSCSKPVPPDSVACPSCAYILPTTISKRKRTATDIWQSVLFVALGGILVAFFIGLFAQTIGPAIDVFRNLPEIGGLHQLVTVANSRFVMAPLLLSTVSYLMWSLAGIFLILGGILALLRGKGLAQASAAAVLMAFGLVADLTHIFILYYDSVAGTGQAYTPAQAVNAYGQILYLQLAIFAVVFILLALKRRSKRKLKFRQAAAQNRQLRMAARQQATQLTASAPPAASVQAPHAPEATPPQNPPEN